MRRILIFLLSFVLIINSLSLTMSYSSPVVRVTSMTSYSNNVFIKFNYDIAKLDFSKLRIKYATSKTQSTTATAIEVITPSAIDATKPATFKAIKVKDLLQLTFEAKGNYILTIEAGAFKSLTPEFSYEINEAIFDKNFKDPVKSTYEKYSFDKEFLYFTNLNDLIVKAYENGIERKKLDENGIILTLIDNRYVYDPIPIAQYGLQKYGLYTRTKDEALIPTILKMGDWLIDNQDIESGKWKYNFNFHVSGMQELLKKGWSCAMMQGQAMSLLTRCYLLTKDQKYLDAAKLAMLPLNIDVKDKGLRAWLGKDIFFEEYPTLPHSFVLNGFMFTLLGLDDYFNVSHDKTSKTLFDKGIKTLTNNLYKYDNEVNSIYHLGYITKKLPKHISTFYHKVHISELNALYDITGEAILKSYADLWSSYISK